MSPSKGKLILTIAVVTIAIGVWFLTRPTGPLEPVTIGVTRWVTNEEYDKNISAFKEALAAAGFIEGKNITYIIENPELDAEKQKQIIRSFVEKQVDLIYSLTTPGTLIAKELAPKIPIVFSVVTYPVEAGVIASLHNSQNNLVGTRNWVDIEDQLAAFREVAPEVKVIGFVHRQGEPNSTIQYHEFKAAAADAGIEVIEITPATVEGLQAALDEVKGRVDALYSACDTLVQGGGEEIVIVFAKTSKLPDFTCNKSGVLKGSLVGTVADFSQIGKLAGEKAAKILRGTSPASLETNTVARPFIYINQKTADDLGITIPPDLFIRAKEVIYKDEIL
ncbi:MAG: ABC transporter substrate-binding protein [Candidatus Bipolaricaulia bacterium]